ncbi:MAG: flavin reductase [Bacteroidota bacterium]
MKLSLEQIKQLDDSYRKNLINSISGFKSANLIGTIDEEAKTNVAIFNSVIHLGASPALMGFIMRPVSVRRHTYENIRSVGFFTINHVLENFFVQAHQTSARYPENVSEFDACNLSTEFSDLIPAPYVKESSVKIGLEYIEEHRIQANDTILIVGKIMELFFPRQIVDNDGFLSLDKISTVAIGGLDAYFRPERVARLAYAKPNRQPSELIRD